MPIHDWTRVSAGTFHAFHNAWIAHLQEALNGGILPAEYYALGEQRSGDIDPDVLTLHASEREMTAGEESCAGAVALADAPPRVSLVAEASSDTAFYAARRRSLVVRHVSGDRVVAIGEIVSLANKHSSVTVEKLVHKVLGAILQGIHVLLIDLFAGGRHDPHGLHALIWEQLEPQAYRPPAERPLTLASYRAGPAPTAYIEPTAVDRPLQMMPLFITTNHYVNVPLEETYMAAYHGMPERWRKVIEDRSPG